jgi:hypothetical protein
MTDQRTESVVRDQSGMPGIHIVQTGWRISDKDGDVVGMVVGRDGTSMTVDLAGGGGERVTIPTQLIAEEEEDGMRATLAVSSDELMRTMPAGEDQGVTRGDPPPLT